MQNSVGSGAKCWLWKGFRKGFRRTTDAVTHTTDNHKGERGDVLHARAADGTMALPTPSAICAVIEPCSSLDELVALRGQIKKLRNERSFDKDFLRGIFEKRDKQLLPRDLLAAFLPTRRSTRTGAAAAASGAVARRAVGILRRSLKVDKRGRCSLFIDFVFVSQEARGLHIGRALLNAGIRLGKQKDVKLSVAGSDQNLAAVKLYESVGFRWTSEQKTEMLLDHSLLPPDGEGGPIARGSSAIGSAEDDSAAMHSMGQSRETMRRDDASALARPTPLSVDIDSAASHHAVGAPGQSTPGASGATPHLSQLRLSPGLSSGQHLSTSGQRPRTSPRAHGSRPSPLARPSASAHAAEMVMLPPPMLAPSRSSLCDPTHTGTASKRRALPPPPPFAESPDVKSTKAAHGASPRSPARTAQLAAQAPSWQAEVS